MTTWLPTEWARLGNQVPHFNFKFQMLQNPSFEPFIPAYKEVSHKIQTRIMQNLNFVENFYLINLSDSC